jgi:translation initiation factor 1
VRLVEGAWNADFLREVQTFPKGTHDDTIDPFADNKPVAKINIRIQQRNGKKSITTIQGLDADLDEKRICRAMRKEFNCNGNIEEDKDYGTIIQLQGDHTDYMHEYLLNNDIDESSIKIKG